MKALIFLTIVGLINKGCCAPVLGGDRPHRESTKAILNLEQQLKSQAGENKHFYPNAGGMMLPPPPPEQPISTDEEDQLEAQISSQNVDGLEEPQIYPLSENTAIQEVGDTEPEPVDEYQEPGVEDADALDSQGISEEDAHKLMAEEEAEHAMQQQAQEEAPDAGGEGGRADDDTPEQQQDGAYSEKELFLDTLTEMLREHPELIDELQGDTELYDQYYGADDDRNDAIKAELAAARGYDVTGDLAQPQGGGIKQEYEPKSNYNTEGYQEYIGDNLAREVSKKRGYDTPDEYVDWVRLAKQQGYEDPALLTQGNSENAEIGNTDRDMEQEQNEGPGELFEGVNHLMM